MAGNTLRRPFMVLPGAGLLFVPGAGGWRLNVSGAALRLIGGY